MGSVCGGGGKVLTDRDVRAVGQRARAQRHALEREHGERVEALRLLEHRVEQPQPVEAGLLPLRDGLAAAVATALRAQHFDDLGAQLVDQGRSHGQVEENVRQRVRRRVDGREREAELPVDDVQLACPPGSRHGVIEPLQRVDGLALAALLPPLRAPPLQLGVDDAVGVAVRLLERLDLRREAEGELAQPWWVAAYCGRGAEEGARPVARDAQPGRVAADGQAEEGARGELGDEVDEVRGEGGGLLPFCRS